jgi:hypothetical protein
MDGLHRIAEEVLDIVKDAPDLFDPRVPRPDLAPFLRLRSLKVPTGDDDVLRQQVLNVANLTSMARAELTETPQDIGEIGSIEAALFWAARRNRAEWALRSLGVDLALLSLLPRPDPVRLKQAIDKKNSGYVQMYPPIRGVHELVRKTMELGDLPDVVRSMRSELPPELSQPILEAERSIGQAFLRVLPRAREELAMSDEANDWSVLFSAAGLDPLRPSLGGPRVEDQGNPVTIREDSPDLAIEKAVGDGDDAITLAVRVHDREAEGSGNVGELLPPLRNAVIRFRDSLRQAKEQVKEALGGPWTPAKEEARRWKDALDDLKDIMEKLDENKERWKL